MWNKSFFVEIKLARKKISHNNWNNLTLKYAEDGGKGVVGRYTSGENARKMYGLLCLIKISLEWLHQIKK